MPLTCWRCRTPMDNVRDVRMITLRPPGSAPDDIRTVLVHPVCCDCADTLALQDRIPSRPPFLEELPEIMNVEERAWGECTCPSCRSRRAMQRSGQGLEDRPPETREAIEAGEELQNREPVAPAPSSQSVPASQYPPCFDCGRAQLSMLYAVNAYQSDSDTPSGRICSECACSDRWRLCYTCSRYRPAAEGTWHRSHNEGLNTLIFICGRCISTGNARQCPHCERLVRTQFDWDEEAECCYQCLNSRVEAIVDTEPAEGDFLSYRNEDDESLDDDDEPGIYDWNYEVPFLPQGNSPVGRFYGVELEVEVRGYETNRNEAAEESVELFGTIVDDYGDRIPTVVAKYDGSLTYGFELVSVPGTLDALREIWDPFLRNRPSYLRSWDTTTCGMHVHVSRASMSKLTIGKVGVFINAAANSQFVTRIAGRRPNYYCRRLPKRVYYVTRQCFGHQSAGKYQAVRLKRHTLEFRLFRGTLVPETFYKNLQFCEALIEFCEETSIERLHYDNFVEWLRVQKPRKRWKELRTYIEDKCLPALAKKKEMELACV